MNATVITALYDINRSSHGDGRTMQQYFDWLEKTLYLNTKFVIFIQDTLYEKLKELISKNKTIMERVIIKITTLDEIPYYIYKPEIDRILNSDEYQNIIRDSSRIECKLSLYNIIQYSKLEWIRKIIEENPYNSSHFFWMDAGCSRFFGDVNITKEWPVLNNSIINNIIIQGRNDLKYYPYWNSLHLDSTNLLCGTMFGGDKTNMIWLADMIKTIFEELLNKNIVNNEQIALAILWKQFPEKFNIYINNTNEHLPLFKKLSYSS